MCLGWLVVALFVHDSGASEILYHQLYPSHAHTNACMATRTHSVEAHTVQAYKEYLDSHGYTVTGVTLVIENGLGYVYACMASSEWSGGEPLSWQVAPTYAHLKISAADSCQWQVNSTPTTLAEQHVMLPKASVGVNILRDTARICYSTP